MKVEKGLYSITCDVDNMDYRNLGESEKEALYVRLLRVYNLFEPTTHLQWSVIVRVVGRRSILDEVLISHQPDGLDRLRDEVNEVLTDRASKGKTDIETRLLLTICTKADNEAEAQSILDGLVKDIRPDFESMGSGLTVLSGAEWLEIVAGVFWPSDALVFDWATLVDTKTGKATGSPPRTPWPDVPRVRAAHLSRARTAPPRSSRTAGSTAATISTPRRCCCASRPA
ncbi:MAG: hypothetical protein ACLSVD_01035 [Eggerthellaceae bacterium]